MTHGQPTQKDAANAAPGQERFDEILSQLQAIVQQLEQSNLSLEDSLKAFEQGVELSRKGQQILDAAEQRVETLLRDGRLVSETTP